MLMIVSGDCDGRVDLDAIVGDSAEPSLDRLQLREDFRDRELSVTCSCNRRVQDVPVNLARANQEREVVFHAADVQLHRGVADRGVDAEDGVGDLVVVVDDLVPLVPRERVYDDRR